MSTMRITIVDREHVLRQRLSERLERAALLQCPAHGERVVEVTISARENGWFDARWITCCEDLERQAAAIVKDRC